MLCCRPNRDITLGESVRDDYWLTNFGCRRRVAELHLLDGTQTDREDHIIAQFEQFYTDLYVEVGLDGVGVEDYLASVPLPRLPLTDGEALDGDITIAEVREHTEHTCLCCILYGITSHFA
ncbi:hypothetical protein NDU88_004571 [Pleurodeles waltl]|uniref:Uncharacterized protein n=1 Tax=Pleurodeles waltl TaxID=8319 RepID=A0AAV7W5C7_PLEWA|nr:hypothetical protein NDU88_004571 [Pleurodeles waltl]